MTPQEIFDKVCERLRDGTGQALGEYGCEYLSRKGLKCAVGIFIPDGHPAQNFDGDLGNLFEEYPDSLPDFFGPNIRLLGRLQNVHDAGCSWTGLRFSQRGETHLKCVATDLNLTYREPVQ